MTLSWSYRLLAPGGMGTRLHMQAPAEPRLPVCFCKRIRAHNALSTSNCIPVALYTKINVKVTFSTSIITGGNYLHFTVVIVCYLCGTFKLTHLLSSNVTPKLQGPW